MLVDDRSRKPPKSGLFVSATSLEPPSPVNMPSLPSATEARNTIFPDALIAALPSDVNLIRCRIDQRRERPSVAGEDRLRSEPFADREKDHLSGIIPASSGRAPPTRPCWLASAMVFIGPPSPVAMIVSLSTVNLKENPTTPQEL